MLNVECEASGIQHSPLTIPHSPSDLSKLDPRMRAKLLSRMHEPVTRPFPFASLRVRATLSPLRGARGTRHSHRECPSPRLRGEGAAKRRMRGSRCANLDSTGNWQLATGNS